MSKIDSINFCDIKIVNASRYDFTNYIVKEIERHERKIVCFSLNGQSLSDYHKSESFRQLMDQADLIHADGMSIVKASKYVSRNRLIERIATTDWFHDVAKYTEEKDLSHFFLGATPEIIEKTVSNVRKTYPKLNICGYHHGYYKDIEDIVKLLNDKKPDILWLGLGRPKQEKVALLLKEKTEVRLLKTCGGLFDFLSGKNKRAPIWVQKLGMEWVYRLYLEPKRLFKRYFQTNLHSSYLFLKFFLLKIIDRRYT